MDFTSDSLADGRKFRKLNVIYDYSREVPGIEVDFSLPAKRVTGLLDRIVTKQSRPQGLGSDNGPEFTGEELQTWCWTNEVELRWIEPGKPTQNAYIDRFNGTSRRVVGEWVVEYNTERPNQALGFMIPADCRQTA